MAAQINPIIGDVEGNASKVLSALERAKLQKIDVVVFSELVLTGYFPEDLLFDDALINACMKQLERIAPATRGLFVAIGMPRHNDDGKGKFLYNSAAIFSNGLLLGYKDKTLLPMYDVFDERRFFESGKQERVWEYRGHRIAVTICEDVWKHLGVAPYAAYLRDPVAELKQCQPDILLNLSGSPYSFDRKKTRVATMQEAVKLLKCPAVLCNQVGANDQLIFDGYSFFLNEKGELMQMARGFVEEDLVVDLNTHACPCPLPKDEIANLYSALVLGVRDYFHKQGFTKGILGLSGGIDSSLVACIAKEALGAENVMSFYLPARFSSAQSALNARQLSQTLGIELKELSIDAAFQYMLDWLEPFFENRPFDATEENMQARIRMLVLMAFSNKMGGIVLNTGNKSEMAVGYTTLYGDMAGGLGVLHDVEKSLVYQLAAYVNRNEEIIPKASIESPPSPELRSGQTDFDTLPSFEVLDSVIKDYVEHQMPPEKIAQTRNFPLSVVLDIVYRIHSAEYKRRQAPIGLRVTQKAFSKGRYVPIVEKFLAPL